MAAQPSNLQSSVPAGVWISEVSALLQARWPSIDPTRLDDVAADLWRNGAWRALAPGEAAERWLEPVGSAAPGGVRR